MVEESSSEETVGVCVRVCVCAIVKVNCGASTNLTIKYFSRNSPHRASGKTHILPC